uniref:Rx N-terminal domain-containing protein n=1 Tax=Ananas comosus var. bracteatus TaxID=296719 RepID=A0A6V7QJ30_ANACO|nr:unnamed protein product [Ananas comosus var. bracteatus]
MPVLEPIILAAVGWVASPVVAKLLNKAFASSGLNAEKKLRKLRVTVLQVLKSVIEKAEGGEYRSEVEDWLQRLKDAYDGVQDALDLLNNRRLKRAAAAARRRAVVKGKLIRLNKLEKIANEAETLCKLLDTKSDQAVAPYGQTISQPQRKVFGRDDGSQANDTHRLEGDVARLTAVAEVREGEIVALERRVGAVKEAEEEAARASARREDDLRKQNSLLVDTIREKDDALMKLRERNSSLEEEIIKLTDALVVLEGEKKNTAAVLGAVALGAVAAAAAAVTAVYLHRSRR